MSDDYERLPLSMGDVKIAKNKYDPNAHFKARKWTSLAIKLILSVPLLPFDLLNWFGDVVLVKGTDWLIRDRASGWGTRLSNWERGFPLFGSSWEDE